MLTFRQRQARAFPAYFGIWAFLLLAMVALKLGGVITNPWPIVLAPVWGAPVAYLAIGVGLPLVVATAAIVVVVALKVVFILAKAIWRSAG